MKKHNTIAIAISMFSIHSFGQVNNASKYTISNVGKGFIENKGQIADQNHKPNSEVKYLLTTPGFNIQLRQTGFSYDTYTDENLASKEQPQLPNNDKFKASLKFKRHYHRVDIELLGCNPNAEMVTEEKSDTYLNYFTAGTPEGGVVNVYLYQNVIYKNIYPDIDLVFYAQSSQSPSIGLGQTPVEYNFIVHPGGNTSDIKLAYKGANKISLADNTLLVNVAAGNFAENIPNSYYKDTKQTVKVNYALPGNNIYGFSIPNSKLIINNSTSDLIIDPTPCLLWGTYYGGTGIDDNIAITLDASDNVYITGGTESSTDIATIGAYQTTYEGNEDIFIAKFNPSGSALIWGTYYGGTSYGFGTGIALDASDNIYITGGTASTTNITTAGAYQTVIGGVGGDDAFVAKFSPSGSALLWGTYYGGALTDFANGIALDANDNVYITGYTESSTGIATAGAYQTVFGGSGNNDAFIAKFNSSGSALLWGSYYGGAGSDEGFGIAFDASYNVYITGYTNSTSNIATAGAYQTALGGSFDAFAAKFNPSGSALLWGSYYGGASDDYAYGIALDASDNIYITGLTESSTNIATAGAYKTIYTGGANGNAFIAKLSSSGSALLWGTYYGGTGEDQSEGIVLDASDNVYITGITESATDIATTSAYQPIYGGDLDAFVAQFNPSGSALLWGTYYGGTAPEVGQAIALDESDNVYITGSTQSYTNIATAGAYLTNNNDGTDGTGFVAKFACTSVTGIDNPPSNSGQITAYPNPTNGMFNIGLSSKEQGISEMQIEVYNVLGEKVYSTSLNLAQGDDFSVNLSTQANGIYLYRVTNNESGTLLGEGKIILQK